MIDLHLHTTASDGLSAPDELVGEAAALGIHTLAVTDHDTVAAVGAVREAAAAAGIRAIAGIEITAVHDGRDIHVLGYFIDVGDAALDAFLVGQREDRRRRVFEISRRLDALGVPVDTAPFDGDAARSGKSLGRPLVAAALIKAGHVPDISAAFDRYLGEGKPAYVERLGASPAAVIRRIREAGGIASLAHPGKLGLDGLIRPMVEAGLSAIEVFHPDHTEGDTARYQLLAREHGLAVTGGSDYHGPGSTRAWAFGKVALPEEAFLALENRSRPST